MKRSEKIAAFTTGFAGYPLLELLWRGRTHWSMALAGGLTGLILYPLYGRGKTARFCLKTAAVITVIELAFGIVFNLMLKKDVWDYSQKRWNLWGQICLPYCILWFLMGVPLHLVCKGLKRICRTLP